jgi:hypothetical protein
MIHRIKERKALQAYIERRNRLWRQVIRDNPSFSETEVTARLEQFGA